MPEGKGRPTLISLRFVRSGQSRVSGLFVGHNRVAWVSVQPIGLLLASNPNDFPGTGDNISSVMDVL
jgi:hypothetical protein